MATTFMDARLLKAAKTLLQHGETVECRYVGFGKWVDCLLLDGDATAKTVKLGVWCASGEIKEGRNRKGEPMPIRFTDCLIPEATIARLEEIARVQARASGTTDCTELARAMQFISRVQRGRDGRFADVTHRAERAGVI